MNATYSKVNIIDTSIDNISFKETINIIHKCINNDESIVLIDVNVILCTLKRLILLILYSYKKARALHLIFVICQVVRCTKL